MKMSQPVLMLVIACALQNVATGTAYGSYGVVLNDLVAQFGINRSMASLGLAIVAMLAALTGPLVGRLLDGWSLRCTVIIGLLLGSAGLALAGIANSFVVFLLGFSVIAGLGGAFSGQLPASTLASRWLPERAGLAVAIANLSLLVCVGPPLFAWVTVHFDWRTLMFVLAGLYLLLLLPAWLIEERPPQAAGLAVSTHAAARFRFRDIWHNRAFWLLTLAIGMLFGMTIALSSHIVAFAAERGVPLTTASWLLSFIGGFGVLGGLLFGWISDRLGAELTLAGNAALTGIGWLLLGLSRSFTEIAPCIVLLGICGGGLLAPLGAFIVKQFGGAAFGSVLGLIIQLILPLTFGGAVLVGALYDATHSYRVPFSVFAGLCAVSCALFLSLRRRVPEAQAAR